MNKIIILLLAILLIILTIGSPSANEINDTQINDNYDEKENKSFDDLKVIVENSKDNSIININNDYTYNNNTDFDGINIKSTNVTINGNGHSINVNTTNNVRIFNITGSTININNLIFTNSKHDYGGAIYNTGYNVSITNSAFINNSALKNGGAIYNENSMTISNSIFVNNTSPEGQIFNNGNLNYNIETFDDLQNAINIISGTITLNSNITLNSSKFANGIIINKTISIDCNNYTINGNNLGRIFNICENATLNLNNGNLINGMSNTGGAIYNKGTLNIRNVNLFNNTATSYGGAIFNDNIANIYLTNFDSNKITNQELTSPSESYGGSAIYNWYNATLIMNNSKVSNHKSDLVSGAITTIGNTQIISSYFNNNTAYLGGAISALGNLMPSYKVLSISNCGFIENKALIGGAIYSNGTLLSITESEFNKNTGDKGGAIGVATSNKYIVGLINSTTFLNNIGENGGALWISEGAYILSNSTFINNSACVGAAIEFSGDGYDLMNRITNCNFENNTATKTAGAIYNNKTLNIQDSTFTNNTSPESTFTNFGNINLHITTFTQLENAINEFAGILTLYNDIEMSNQDSTTGININKNLIIDGNNLTTINANNLGGIFNIAEGCNVTLLNIQLINGTIYNKGNLTVANSILYNKNCAIYNTNGSVVVDYNWWGTNNPDWNKLLQNITAPNTFATLNLTTQIDENNDCDIIVSLNWNNTDIIASIPPCYITICVKNNTEGYILENEILEETYHLLPGDTNISVSLHDQKLNSTINAPKITSKIDIYSRNITYGTNLFAVIFLSEGSTGNVSIIINNHTYIHNLTNAMTTIKVKNLTAGNYTIFVKYDGDDNYLANENSKNITVYKANLNLLVEIDNIEYGENFIINATLLDDNENITIDVVIDDKHYIVAIVNGTGVLIGDKLNAGKYNFTAIWTGNENYNNITFRGSFNVNKTSTSFNITYYNLIEGENGSVYINLPSNASGKIIFTLNGKNYTANDKNMIILPKLNAGNYTGVINYLGDNNYLPQTTTCNFTILANKKTYLNSTDVVMIYHDESKFIAKLTDFNNTPIANATILIKVNNITYERITDNKGCVYLNLNLNPNTYQLFSEFIGNDFYNPVSANNSITIKTTIFSKDIAKMYCNETQFIADFTDSKGNPLANCNITFNINGVFYNKTSDVNGTTTLNINLNPGNYIITAYNPITNEEKSFNITVYSLIESNNLTKYYKNESQFAVKVYEKNGKLAINKTIQFNINGVFYTKTTNDKGIANLGINLNPGNYTITTIVDGLNIGNNISVLPTLITKDLTMDYLDNSTFNVTTLDSQGNPIANKTVKFNINGVFYNKITNNDGVAILNINLNPGKYIITSYWRDYEIGNKITING